MKTWLKNRVMMAVLGLFVCFGVGFAEPAPLGFTLGKATLDEVKAKYGGKLNGNVLYLNHNQIGINGLQELWMRFDENNVLIIAGMTFNKNKFDELFSQLKEKYKLVNSKIPFVGDKYALFKDGKGEIRLNAPHLSFSMEVIYGMSEVLKEIENSQNEKEKQRQDKQKSLL